MDILKNIASMLGQGIEKDETAANEGNGITSLLDNLVETLTGSGVLDQLPQTVTSALAALKPELASAKQNGKESGDLQTKAASLVATLLQAKLPEGLMEKIGGILEQLKGKLSGSLLSGIMKC